MELSTKHYDFAGWATCSGVLCSDGRTIMPDAFKHHDGQTFPLVWNHRYDASENVLGKALLHSRNGGMYAYCSFNDTESGRNAKKLVEHGDIVSLSICANQLQHNAQRGVTHGMIRELSLVLAGANPGALIDTVMKHGEEVEDEAIIYTGENIVLFHSDEKSEETETDAVEETVETETSEAVEETEDKKSEESKTEEEIVETEEPDLEHSDESTKEDSEDKSIENVIANMSDEQKAVMFGMLGMLIKNEGDDDDTIEHSEGDEDVMKKNVFDQTNETTQDAVLTHADQMSIIENAKKSSVGTLKEALRIYGEQNDTIAHGLDLGDTETLNELLPDYKNLTPGAPEILGPDQSWVMSVINKVHKSPFSRIRTRHADARAAEIREKLAAKGYTKAEEKKLMGKLKLIGRSFDPQTIYIKDELNRDDIIDITDFSIVEYNWKLMREMLFETLALSILVGDGREDTDPDKIKEDHIRSVWHDDELYTMHVDVDVEAMRNELQGTDTNAHFGENYIYAEAIIQKLLYARENFKGSGTPDLYCDPHLVNVMLLARDMNGRRIYDSKADLARTLNVGAIHEVEQLKGKTRTTEDGKTKKLLGLVVNLADYQLGSTKGGEVTKFEDFDIDFNKHKYLLETRLSGAPVKLWSAIALEEPVAEEAAG